ncbi:MAG: pyridoxal phosphate-dependent aminotransferase [Spirochaetes bacterium]|nr:pyridoxal phosphate-dependent aminotransferase [Spirochaetota bacterium]
MNEFAQRAEIADSETLKINNDVMQLRRKGIDVIPFVAGEPDFDTPEPINQAAIEAIYNNYTHYTNVAGISELREKIVEKLKLDNNLTYNPDEIIVGCGAKQNIANALLALIDNKAEVMIPSPYWVSYIAMVEICGGKPNIIKTTKETNYKINYEILKKSYNKNCKVLILNSPSNPTGAVYNLDELKEIAKFCLENNIYIISDEIYEKLIYDNMKHISIASLSKEIWEKTIVINGFSKSFAMTGWRVGYSAAPKKISDIMKKIQANMTSHTSSISQYAALKAFSLGSSFYETLRTTFEKRRDYILNELKDNKYIEIVKPNGAFYIFMNISKTFGKSYKDQQIKNDNDFYNILLNEFKVALVPGSAFGDSECMRLSYSYKLETITEGIKRIKDFLSLIN